MDEKRKAIHFLRLLFPIGCVVLPIVGLFWMNADWVPKSAADRLPRATIPEVLALLGDPDHVDGRKWVFTGAFRFAEFQVFFSDDGRVEDFYYDR